MLGIRAVGQDATHTLFLPVQTAEAQAHLDAWYARGVMTELALPQVPAGTDQFPVPPAIPAPNPRVGMLYWPAFGAQRFAFGTFLIDYYTLGLLRTALNGASVTPGTGPSTFAGDNRVILSYTDQDVEDPDAPEVPRDFTLFLVAARPLSQTVGTDPPPDSPPSEDDGYLITLVDQRYYWQFQAGTGGSGVPASWDSLFTLLLNQLNAPSGTDDAVPSAYLTPSSKWDAGSVAGMPTGLLFDSAANSVGMRVVVNPDETVSIQGSGLVHKNDVASFHATNISEFNHNAGGLIAAPECIRAVPEKVVVVFPGSGCASPGVKSKALNSFSWAPTDDYYGIAGVSGAQAVLWSDAGSGTADADQTALAAQYAQDWYTWQVVPLEALYSGFPTLPSSGFVGHYELHHSATEGFTRVTRPPVNYGQLFGTGNKCGSTVFKVRLTGQCTTTACGVDGGTGVWAADELQESGGSITVVGPLGGVPLSGPGNPYCLYPTAAVDGTTGSPAVGDIYTAVPNPKNANTWLFTPKLTNGTCGGRWYAEMSQASAIQIQQLGGTGRCSCVPSETDDPTAGLALYVAAKMGWLRVNMGKTCCGCGSLVFRLTDDAGNAELDLEAFHLSCDGTGIEGGNGVFNKTLTLDCTGTDADGVPFAIFSGWGTDACANEDLIGCFNTFRIKVRCLGSVSAICTCPWCTKCCSGAAAFGWWGNFSGFSNPSSNGDWVYGYDATDGNTTGCHYVASCPSSASSAPPIASSLDVVGSGTSWNFQLNHNGSIYQQSVGLWNCCSSNVMSKVSGDGPASITLNPILANGECPTCTKSWPETVYLKILNITATGGAAATNYTIGQVISMPQSSLFTEDQPRWCASRSDCGAPPYPASDFSCNSAADGSNPGATGCLGFTINSQSPDEAFGASGIGNTFPGLTSSTVLDCSCTGTYIHGTSTITCNNVAGCSYGPLGSTLTYEFQVTDAPP